MPTAVTHPLLSIPNAVSLLRLGKILAYPTEAVFGLGCDPQNQAALESLLALKQRSPSKGLILIAESINHLLPYVELSAISKNRWAEIISHWPGPYTWVIPASTRVLPLVRGQHTSIAVRVTAHPVASRLCQQFGGALISTSANQANKPALKTAREVFEQFGEEIAGVVQGEVGDALQPTTIRDAMTGESYR